MELIRSVEIKISVKEKFLCYCCIVATVYKTRYSIAIYLLKCMVYNYYLGCAKEQEKVQSKPSY